MPDIHALEKLYTELLIQNCEELYAENERLRHALHQIANDYVELSHEKIRWQRDDFMKIARKALEKNDG